MELNKCLGCMEDIQGYPCPHCGYDPKTETADPSYLQPETILAGKYLVGKVTEAAENSTAYLGWDIGLERKVSILECSPRPEETPEDWDRRATDFLQEGRSAEKADRILDLFKNGGRAYQVLQFVEPKTEEAPASTGFIQESVPEKTEVPGKRKTVLIAAVAAAVVLCVGVGLYIKVLKPASDYKKAQALMDAGSYREAIQVFTNLGDYKDSPEKIQEAEYGQAQAFLDDGSYDEALDAFTALGDYQDSPQKVELAKEGQRNRKAYQEAMALVEAKRYPAAAIAFHALGDFEDSAQQAQLARSTVQPVPVAAGFSHTVGVRSDGTVMAVGSNGCNKCEVGEWGDIVAVAAGLSHTVGLRSDGTVVAVGYNLQDDRCEVSQWRNIVAIGAGDSHTVGLRADGTVTAVGENKKGQCNVGKWKDIVAIYVHDDYTIGLRIDGTVVSTENWDLSGWKNIVAISGGYSHAEGLRSDGTVVCVGKPSSDAEEIATWKDIVSIAAASGHVFGLRSDGTVAVAGYTASDGRCDVAGWKNIAAIFAGDTHTVGLYSDGTLVSVGENDDGECNVSGWKNIGVN